MGGWNNNDRSANAAIVRKAPLQGGGDWGRKMRQQEQSQMKDAKVQREVDYFWDLQEKNRNKDWERGGPPRKGERFLQEEEKELFESKHCLQGIDFEKYATVDIQRTGRNADNIPVIESFDQCFHMFELPKWLDNNVKLMKYSVPTPCQKYAMPAGLVGRDVMCCAQTGSGKTAAFLLPLVAAMDTSMAVENSKETYSGPARPISLIMGPTRELVSQIFLEARKFTFRSPFKAVSIYGGVEAKPQLSQLSRGVDLIAATPGRLIDFIEREVISVEHISYLVLDEADRMLDMGFEPQIRTIVQKSGMPPKEKRQTMFFSATFPKEIQILAADFLYDYIWIAVGRVGAATQTVKQDVKPARTNADKLPLLLEELQEALPYPLPRGEKHKLVLVFVAMKRTASWLVREINRNRYRAQAIHGDLTQLERERNLSSFKEGSYPVLVATDVASRGLDIPDVALVINYDLPGQIDDYIHRIGRSGRIGNRGRAVSFFLTPTGNDGNHNIAVDLLDRIEESGGSPPEFLEQIVASRPGNNWRKDKNKGGNYSAKRDFRNGNYGSGDGKGRSFGVKGKGKGNSKGGKGNGNDSTWRNGNSYGGGKW